MYFRVNLKAVLKFLQYVKNEKGLIVLNFLLNLVFIVLQLTTLMLIMPVLKFLFSSDKQVVETKKSSIDMVSGLSDLYHNAMSWFAETAKGSPQNALMYLCIALVVVTVLKNFSRYMAMNAMILIRNRAVHRMRVNIYNKCLNMPVAFFNEEKKGDLLSRMSNDMKEIEFALMVALESLYFQPLNIIIFITALIFLSPKLTIYILIFLPVTAVIIGLLGKSLRRKSSKNQTLAGRVLTAFEETLGGMRIIKGFNAASFFSDKYKKEDEAYMKNNISVQRRYDASSPMSETIGLGISAILLWLGGNLVFQKQLDPEFFLTYFAIFSQLIPPFKAFSSAIYTAQKGMASLERIEELVNADEVVMDPVNPKTVKFENEIVFNQVSFGYTDKIIIENINFKINKGETVALVGPSGAGKTTITDLVARFYDVKSGEISIDGINIKDFKQDELRQIIGIVSQESVLFNDSIENNIRIGKQAANEKEIEGAAEAANALTFIQKSEQQFETNVGERGSKLSGGQRQRISIARALLKDPQILILDEATSALDSESEKAVQQALEKLMQNRTSIVIAHRLSTVQHADRIIVMDHGKIIETGTHTELLNNNGLYSRLIKLQQLA